MNENYYIQRDAIYPGHTVQSYPYCIISIPGTRLRTRHHVRTDRVERNKRWDIKFGLKRIAI